MAKNRKLTRSNKATLQRVHNEHVIGCDTRCLSTIMAICTF